MLSCAYRLVAPRVFEPVQLNIPGFKMKYWCVQPFFQFAMLIFAIIKERVRPQFWLKKVAYGADS